MYSPRIAEDLIPVLYRIGRQEGKPMTHIVDGFLRDAIRNYENSIQKVRDDDEKEDYSPVR